MSTRAPLLTTPEVAQMAGRSTRTVLRAVHEGDLAYAQKIGSGPNAAYLFESKAVDRWLAKRAAPEDVPA